MAKLIRITTVPQSLKILLKGQLMFMSKHFQVLGVSSSGKELFDVQIEEGVPVVPIEMSRRITPVKDIIALWQTYCLFKSEKPEIVHTHTPKAGIVGMLAAKMAGVPHRLHTVAGLPLMEASGIKRRILDLVEKLTYKSATKVYPNSKGLYDFILKNGYAPSAKIKVIGNGSSNGIDICYFSPSEVSEEKKEILERQLGLRPEDFLFVFVGRIVKDKGINELIKAFSTLTNVKLLLVGNPESELDPILPETQSMINENPNILSVGFQRDVRAYFAVSDALVFPSYREGFPNVVMQAGAMGLPCIVSNINGCNEIIENGKNGIIVEPKNIESLVKAMKIMIEDKAFYQKMKSNARQKIVDNYQREFVWNEILLEYQNCLKAQ